MMKAVLLLVTVAISLAVVPASANMRLPMRYEHPPSSAIFSPVNDMEVVHEELSFDCGEKSCDVTAIYQVLSPRSEPLKLSFISPSRTVTEAVINGTRSEVVVSRFAEADRSKVSVHSGGTDYIRNRPEDYPPKACFGETPDLTSQSGWGEYVMCQLRKTDLHSGAFFGIDESWRLFEYTFAGTLNKGTNILRVRYRQPMSVKEGSGSLKKTRFLSYELWPLKEWRLAEDFTIDLKVRLANPRHGWLFLKRDHLVTAGHNFTAEPQNEYFLLPDEVAEVEIPGPEPVQGGDGLVFRTTMGRQFPDRLILFTGDAKDLADMREQSGKSR